MDKDDAAKKDDKPEDKKDDKDAKPTDSKPEDDKKDDKKDDGKDAKPTSDNEKDAKNDKEEDKTGKDQKPSDYVNFGGAGEEDDPYENDEKTKKDHFRETFITQDKGGAQGLKDQAPLFTMHDMMIPAGRTAKLVRVPDPNHQDFRVTEPLDKLKFTEPTPVIILAGAMGDRAGKTLAGVARAAFRAGACIIDSGVGSGIEKFCMRKSVPLIGVCPEHEISYPVNSQNKKENELTNGHTHFFLTGSDETKTNFKWGEEAKLKAEIAKRVAKGRTKYGGSYTCKIVVVVVGDNTACTQDLVQAKENGFPIIVLEGSQFSADIIAAKGGLPQDDEQDDHKAKEGEGDAEDNIGGAKKQESSAPEGGAINDDELSGVVNDEKLYLCKQNSEHIANITHLLLTVTL